MLYIYTYICCICTDWIQNVCNESLLYCYTT